VEGSKLCLFLVIMLAKCVSSISPRFHYRRLTFCFLPLAAILESPQLCYFLNHNSSSTHKVMTWALRISLVSSAYLNTSSVDI
jgi:hypothetical protein